MNATPNVDNLDLGEVLATARRMQAEHARPLESLALNSLRAETNVPALEFGEPPFNALTGKPLAPGNAWHVAHALTERGITSAGVVTFEQARAAGLGIVKGAKGIPAFAPKQTDNEQEGPSLKRVTLFSVADVVGAPDLARTEQDKAARLEQAHIHVDTIRESLEASGVDIVEGSSRAFTNGSRPKPQINMPDSLSFSSAEGYSATLVRMAAQVAITRDVPDVGAQFEPKSEEPAREQAAYRHIVAGLATQMVGQRVGLSAVPEHCASINTVGLAPLERAGHDLEAVVATATRDAFKVSRSLLERVPELDQSHQQVYARDVELMKAAGAERMKVMQAERALKQEQSREALGLSAADAAKVTALAQETLRTPTLVDLPDTGDKARFMGSVTNEAGKELLVVGVGKGRVAVVKGEDLSPDSVKPTKPGQRLHFDRNANRTPTLKDGFRKVKEALVEVER
jgi:antirestriction protein ArdC